MRREQVIDKVLSARTPEQCEEAKNLIIAWMRSHPKDFGMLDAGEQVATIMDGYAHEALMQRPVI